MNILDLVVLAFGSALTLLVFVARTDIEKSRAKVPVRVKARK